ncbi:GNAT family N-acetyltransferase [Paludibacterium yongneupense]|uniref:GNAT family N-acetyltransferase n=1 Tax=Paludibacterium yongneupense TaxID=400061 RepID=UPI00040AEE5B|nr:GNAT family N-acetyltransferase [Paludibacterium yongneupense]
MNSLTTPHAGTAAVDYRRIVSGDVELLADLHARSWRNAYRGIMSPDYLDGDIAGERLAVWQRKLAGAQADASFGVLAFAAGEALGFAYVYPGADPRWGALLDNLHVLPAGRGRGIGRALLREVASDLLEKGEAGGIQLWVFEANRAARDIYHHLGAVAVERDVVAVPGGGRAPAWRYVWPSLSVAGQDTGA